MFQTVSIIFLLFGQWMTKSYQRLLDRMFGGPKVTDGSAPSDPMAGAKRVVLAICGLSLGGLSLLVFPKPIISMSPDHSMSAWFFLVVAGGALTEFWKRYRLAHGLTQKPVDHAVNALIVAVPFSCLRCLVLS